MIFTQEDILLEVQIQHVMPTHMFLDTVTFDPSAGFRAQDLNTICTNKSAKKKPIIQLNNVCFAVCKITFFLHGTSVNTCTPQSSTNFRHGQSLTGVADGKWKCNLANVTSSKQTVKVLYMYPRVGCDHFTVEPMMSSDIIVPAGLFYDTFSAACTVSKLDGIYIQSHNTCTFYKKAHTECMSLHGLKTNIFMVYTK